ncbi:MAG: hypothetical protein CMJ31_08210 [Phycisphaerae bacterium]|nr:hypothetical protein [Phycisphaerae bacterium]
MTETATDQSSASTIDVHRPIVVVGALRSGTTMFGLMLAGHADIAFVGEFEESVRFINDGRLPDPADFAERLRNDRMSQDRGTEPPPTDLGVIGMIHELSRRYAASERGSRVGFTIHSKPDMVPLVWPDARVIQLMRDPRDVARSCIRMGWVGNAYRGCEAWLDTEPRCARLIEALPHENSTTVRYEDLVARPEEELRRVCEFLGLPWDPAILDYPSRSTYGPVDEKLSYQWKRKADPREIELVESRCAEPMKKYGYELSTPAKAPGPIRRAALNLDNRLRVLDFNRRRFGLGLLLARAATRRLPLPAATRRRVTDRWHEVQRAHYK